ncbi:uncharacterized protein LOC8259699 isoform X1 [Ricinus communis]|uniref:DUF538 domain-containing protein n=1 Tax=Ricinus communis TaxID=3988 RepID=B9SMP1_RICCO|nr:uncharacterized protein LOC8259699 isoform X1 [Ricinus communis]EEF35104.1 conserved hypothetical protein [Ricinus communis]|eukprot:XP_002527260.1 uncharacterized protein LOC8259699 [Ricinus communis]
MLLLLHLLILFSLAISITGDHHQRQQHEISFYDVLKDHGLPMGLLPKGVKDFKINETGAFEVHLDQACNAKFESELHYDMNVSGTLSYGQIGALSGISAQELFLWFPVKGIRVDVPSSGLIYFDVGVVSKQFSLSLFETPRDCTAVRDGQFEDIQHGKLIADAVSKSQNGELRYQLDQGNFGRGVL